MDKTLAARLGRLARGAGRRFVGRFALFVGTVFLARQLPGPLRDPAWLIAFAVGAWAFAALVRESSALWEVVVPRLGAGWKNLGVWVTRRTVLWGVLSLFCGVVLAGIVIHHAWPAWRFLATSSLREDEILNIGRYTSQGIAPAVGSYNLARNHIFFNVVNALLPGADSLSPLRARFVSFASVLATLVLLVLYAVRRGWFLAGVAFAGLLAIDLYALKVLLEARGYGLIGLLGTVGAVALCEWLRTRRAVWLTVLAVTTVFGTYTLPYYVIFGGGLMLAAFFHQPSRETFLSGFLALAAIGMLYLPVAGDVLKVAAGYDGEYGDSVTYNFGSIEAFYRTLQYLFSYEIVQIGPLFLVLTLLLVLLFVIFGHFARRSDRIAAAGVAAAVLAMLAFLFFLKSVPIRVSAFLAGPLALLATIMTGSLMAAPFLVPVRPLVIVGFSTLAACVLWKAEIREPLIPRQNWGGIAQLVGRGFPPDAVLWAPKKYAKLMRPYLPDREVTDGPIDDGAFAGGRWLVFDAAFKGGPERARFTWESLPEGVRYVSTPLLINYQRLFFVPPANRGIVRIDQEGRDIPFPAAGRQPRDPALLADSAGDGDALYPPGAEGEFARFEPALSVPGELTVMLQDGAPAGSCNLLFSQILADKRVRAGVQGPDGVWRQVAPFVLGELVSVPLAKENSRAVRLHLTPNPDYRPGPRLSGERPALGLVDAWVTRGTPR